MRRTSLLLVLAAGVAAAQPIQYVESHKVWLITTRHNSYALGLGADGALRHLYWGAPLWRADDVPAAPARRDLSSFDPRQMLEAEEYPGWGGPRYYEPALKITREDGVRDLVLRFASHRIDGNDLDMVLKDINDPVEVTLHYHVYPEHGILRRSATIRNGTARAFTI
jgi:alpha-galactosidase